MRSASAAPRQCLPRRSSTLVHMRCGTQSAIWRSTVFRCGSHERPAMSIATHRLEVLAELADTVAARRSASPDISYTAKLLSQGIEKCAKKVGEEAVEAALAAVKGDREHLRLEAADLFYHLVVLLEASDLPIAEVMNELEKRVGTGGLAEKADRRQV